jgi:zinc transport system ATP-binding protein
MQNTTLLECRNLSKSFGARHILDTISFSVKKGNIVTIIGPNGSGKTTLARIILGLVAADKGSVWRKEGLTVGYMPQKLAIDPVLPLTVRRFLSLAGSTKDAGRYAEVIAETGIGHLLSSQMHSISGGELQRVMLAQILLLHPELLVLDEPVQGVDVQGQAEFYQLIERLRKHYGMTILMISHDLHMVMRTTDHVVCINHHICCEGTAEDVSKHDAYIKLFGRAAVGAIGVYEHHHNHSHDLHGDVVKSSD